MNKELKHTIKFENEDTEIEVEVRLDDVVQIAEIGEVIGIFEEFKELQELDTSEKTTVQEMLASIRPLAAKFKEINTHLDNAFGNNFSETLFKGSHSLDMYNTFFDQLGNEMNAAGIKREEYVKRVRKEHLVNDHKKGSVI